jgi:hypothetical protein
MEGGVARPRFPPHPLVEKLAAGADGGNQARLLGYFGGTVDGVVKVYPSIDDLSVWFEIREEDILAVEDASAEELPHDGSAIWVRGDARIQRCVNRRTSIEARFLAGRIAAAMSGGPGVTYGRAAMAPVEPDTSQGADCGDSKVWPCSVVVGVCLASNDMPCAYTDAYWCVKNPWTLDSCITCAGLTCVGQCHPTFQGCTVLRYTQCVCVVQSAICGNR